MEQSGHEIKLEDVFLRREMAEPPEEIKMTQDEIDEENTRIAFKTLASVLD